MQNSIPMSLCDLCVKTCKTATPIHSFRDCPNNAFVNADDAKRLFLKSDLDKPGRHMKICQLLNSTYAKKNEAYGDSFSVTYKKLGPISAITRINDKFNRLVALSTGTKNNVTDESLDDTLLDMANYCIMTYMERQDERNGDNSRG